MPALSDVARFRPDDDAALVAASFSCPLCLDVEVSAGVVLDGEDARVDCRCEACAVTWTVAVDSAQLLRLILHPPDRDTTAACPRLHGPWTADAPWRRPGHADGAA